MQKILSKKKVSAATIALLLILTVVPSLSLLPFSSARDPPWTVPTSAYITVTPGRVGVNQRCTIVVFVDRYSPTAGGAVGQVWEGYQIDVTKPDGTKETIGPWTCNSAVASDFRVYRPDQIGEYTFVFSWPGGTVKSSAANFNTTAIGDKFLGATSKPVTLVVQSDPVQEWPETSPPTGYWTYPANAMNRAWANVPSNWLLGTWLVNDYQRSGTGPKSAHILWTAPICAESPTSRGYPGGLADGFYPTVATNINDYESSMRAPIIMNGVIYYNAPTTQQSVKYGYYAVDLYTGQQLWHKNGTDNGLNNPYIVTSPSASSTNPTYAKAFLALTCGQMYHYASVNGEGVASFLWIQHYQPTTFTTSSRTWYMIDATTGDWILSLTNVPSGTSITGEDGSLLVYQFNAATGNVLCWNSSKAIYPGGPTSSGAQVFRPPVGQTIDAVNDTLWAKTNPNSMGSLEPELIEALKTPHSGYTMNVTDPSLKNLPAPVAAIPGVTPTGTLNVLQDKYRTPKALFGSSIPTTYGSIGGSVTADTVWVWKATINEHATSYSPWPNLDSSVNTNLGFTVTLDYSKNITVPLPGLNATWTIATVDYDSGTFVLRCAQTGQLWGYNLQTGDLAWGPTETPPGDEQFYYYSQRCAIYDGILLVTGQYTGTIYAYEATQGTPLWVYRASSAPYPYESAYGNQMTLSLGAVCDNVVYTSSTEHSPTNPLWRQSYVRGVDITNGEEMWKLSCFSQGFSIANGYLVTASQYDNLIYCIGKGPSAMTASAPQEAQPLGAEVLITGTVTDQSPGAKDTPAISDDDMQAWMEYLYEQQPKPNNAKGVPVHVTAIDPNNNFQDLGTTISDSSGNFAVAWTPPVPGVYRVTATFDGSNSYGNSQAGTTFLVSEAPAATQPPAQATVNAVSPEMFYAVSAVLIVLILVVALLSLRKK